MSIRKNFGRLFEEQVDAIFEMFTLEQAAVMMRAMINYQTTGEETDFSKVDGLELSDREIKYMNGYFKSQIASMSKSVALINRSRENGEKGGRPKNADTAHEITSDKETIIPEEKVAENAGNGARMAFVSDTSHTQVRTDELNDEDLDELHEAIEELITTGYKNYVSKDVALGNLKYRAGTGNIFMLGHALGLNDEQIEQIYMEDVELNCK